MDITEIKYATIAILAEYLSGPKTAIRSIKLSMGDPDAREWADMRRAVNLHGYLTVKETKKHLCELFGVPYRVSDS